MKNIDILRNLGVKAREYRVVIAVLVLSGLISLIVEMKGPAAASGESESSASTFIPQGFVLVPIEVQNPEALDSILGSFGVVDLFSAPFEGGPARAIAKRIKIVRAPLNPSHFAVLAPEDEAPALVRERGPISVVIQNPTQSGTDFVKAKSRKSRIHVETIE